MYDALRSEPWNIKGAGPQSGEPLQSGAGDDSDMTMPKFVPPSTHSEMRTVSLIRRRLWDEAGWAAMGFFEPDRTGGLPIIALLFRNRVAGQQVFEGLQEDLREEDVRELLRVSIVRGISRSNPAS